MYLIVYMLFIFNIIFIINMSYIFPIYIICIIFIIYLMIITIYILMVYFIHSIPFISFISGNLPMFYSVLMNRSLCMKTILSFCQKQFCSVKNNEFYVIYSFYTFPKNSRIQG